MFSPVSRYSVLNKLHCFVKYKGKIHPTTGHEGLDGE